MIPDLPTNRRPFENQNGRCRAIGKVEMAGLGRPALGLLQRSRLEFVAELGTSLDGGWCSLARCGRKFECRAFRAWSRGSRLGRCRVRLAPDLSKIPLACGRGSFCVRRDARPTQMALKICNLTNIGSIFLSAPHFFSLSQRLPKKTVSF